MAALKLIALDDQDLSIVSAHVQDAVMKVSDLEYLPATKRFVLTMNRFVWEAKSGLFRQHNERRQSVLHFDRVLGAKTSGIQRDKPAEVLSLLAISFIAISKPAGIVELVFSGGGTIMLDVECVEARLADVGGSWEATSRPVHRG
ncbi:DUF2948 family protein [Mesorhizobium sp. M2D.F.Ca.ET.185.01.1.1]|uniref:DUF2948 family protein n=1 Tax=unclassified Mesorhizobium TaxID=325217 RepID=UPI000FCB10AA|nr:MULTISPECIES: DUF2948 family protein [unclassified Mesorhizobium]TGP48330.1 DUF2948 family protein [bacterium M00.F.Ca.ET.230.01.1.1]TGP74377.1 DUF2948 family protein [bacterium M00.F.Ca.ET.227.01.1.1]TGP85063.1 DUF2948 family protein [bacterium M00.F.Ca.ET.221.01.1.1]TGP89146.1 DUF2948 family protein [bacterium M00.F.Ca.ET.222.01.1.1]TGU12795.1 DUF2948 family protein [bacterium M00.F.Ca.ET.163.01.1.1]TGU21301.1 DUF2948 family protein [bacterium M00.F.Ca.ET.156.01.1.1]TGU43698.1 DUF2948 f